MLSSSRGADASTRSAVKRSPLLDLHRARGAHVQPAENGGTVLSFGDVEGEYRAGAGACALLDETTRTRLVARGPDAAGFLHRILANDVRSLRVGAGNRNLLLTSKGKVLEEFDLSRAGEDRFELSTSPERAANLASRLDTYLFTDRVELVEESEDYSPLALCGPSAGAVLEQVLGRAPEAAPRTRQLFSRAEYELVVELVPIAGSPGWRILAPPARVPALWDELCSAGARPCGLVASEVLRIEAGRARFGVDFGEDSYPAEARLEDAFSLSKGCYVGQEVVAKIDTYGGLNKLLVGLRIDRDDPVPAGTRLMLQEEGEWRDVGVLTSATYSFALGTGLALGYVKLKHLAAGTSYRLGDGPAQATLVDLPVRAGALPVTGGSK
jgi:folate-binding protein YgfZ